MHVNPIISDVGLIDIYFTFSGYKLYT